MSREVVIMVAPNGARKTRIDHPNVPLSIEETVDEAVQCHRNGASVLHAHVRGREQEHVLDAGLYTELVGEMALKAPGMLVQITSEAVGRYSPEEQTECIRAVKPRMASMSLREITSGFKDLEIARDFFQWCVHNSVHVQHILYSAKELEAFLTYRDQGIVPQSPQCVLLVLGRYSETLQSEPHELDPFLAYDLTGLDWFTCAFGKSEQACVMKGVSTGGHARIGFENNIHLPDGGVADSTADLVTSLVDAMAEDGLTPAAGESARRLLGVREK